jgi:hypothetical protein
MITVKTYPSPSDTYGETVCVAGARLDRGASALTRSNSATRRTVAKRRPVQR